jgi:hypothetical protein
MDLSHETVNDCLADVLRLAKNVEDRSEESASVALAGFILELDQWMRAGDVPNSWRHYSEGSKT